MKPQPIMNYFKLYETQRNNLKVGSKWESRYLGIVKIIDLRDCGSVLYEYITYAPGSHCRSKRRFLDHFKPYNETST